MQKCSMFLSTLMACSSLAWGAIDHLIEITPTVGGNFHINKRGYAGNDEIAAGLRLGVRATQQSLIELGWEHMFAAHFEPAERNIKHNNNRYFANYVHELMQTSWFAPYALGGFGYERLGIETNGMNHDAFAQLGVGVRLIATKWLHLKAEVRDAIIFDGRNDLVASVGLTIPLGSTPQGRARQEQEERQERIRQEQVKQEQAAKEKEAAIAQNNAASSPLTPQPAPSRAGAAAAGAESMRLSTPQGGDVVGQKHQGEGFMEGYTGTSTQHPRVGEIIDTDDGQHQVTRAVTLNQPEVRFAFDSYDIATVFEVQIREFSEHLLSVPAARTILEGHTDWVGPEAYNLALSRKRAESVKSKMMEFGVGADKIDIRAYGETRPIADNNTAAGRAQNRRVELILIEPVAQ